jgi:hypothetical protein
MNTQRSLKHPPERVTHLPADKNNSKKFNSKFQTLVKPIAADLAREAAFHEVIANLENFHYEYEVTRFRDRIGYVSLICNDDMKIHIRTPRDKAYNELPMTTWHEHHEILRDAVAASNHGIAGDYSYHAHFELIHNEWDPEADEDSPRFIDHGDGVIGSVESSSYDFQQFIENAVFQLSVIFDTELHPKRIPLKREIA